MGIKLGKIKIINDIKDFIDQHSKCNCLMMHIKVALT